MNYIYYYYLLFLYFYIFIRRENGNYEVKVGSLSKLYDSSMNVVKKITIHPNYNNKTFKHDVALVELSNLVKTDDYVQIACLPTHPAIPNTQCYSTGWGVTEEGWLKHFLNPNKSLSPTLSPTKIGGILGITLNNVWSWGSSSKLHEEWSYHFIAITPRSTLIQNGSFFLKPYNCANKWLLLNRNNYLILYNCEQIIGNIYIGILETVQLYANYSY